ncbi:MAG: leucine--tRNA ligase [bacterium]|nr:leucine--tRNA ligase [bacterium]
MDKYEPATVEPKVQALWEKNDIYRAVDFDSRPKKYILIEFPYPSGERLHVGHGRSYTALDAVARKLRMRGFNVLYPIGWDAFGLPVENYAIKTGINPAITTKQNIDNARIQAKAWGLSFDWSREVDTTDPKYYKWTQWIFLKMLERGLAYQAEVPVNWCPACKTNLANEEVLADGRHERCGGQTERRMQKQWILKITDYADRLLDDLKLVDYLPKIRIQQENWIGRTAGVTINYPILRPERSRTSSGGEASSIQEKDISCYTTRPDTNFGATFVVISPEHPMVKELTTKENEKSVTEYIEMSRKKSEHERTSLEKEKTGAFTGSTCLNRLTSKEMPIWISDFVILTAGTGIVVGVPAHDERDFEFANKYGLEIIPVIKQKGKDWDFEKAPFTEIDAETEVINSDFLNWMSALEAKEKITDYLVEKGWGKRAVNYHLRDWVFSRQHYWGEPIPVVFCPNRSKHKISNIKYQISNIGGIDHDVIPVPEEQLPVELPPLEKYQPSGTGESPLAKVEEWVKTKCPKCGGSAKRETDTMPNWAGSNWYYLAYVFAHKLRNQRLNIKNQKEKNIFEDSKDLLQYWMPIDLYNGGMEHTTLHLLYSRFVYKFLFDIGVVPGVEPYARRHSHGVVLGPDGQKMSKSRGNVVNPDEVVKKYGADTFRLYEMFMGPFEQMVAWDDEGIVGCYRFLKRVWQLTWEKVQGEPTPKDLESSLHRTIKKVTEDLDELKFNTAIAAMMEFINEWAKPEAYLNAKDAKMFLKILAPFAPHITEELWSQLKVPREGEVPQVPRVENSRGTRDARDTFESVHQQSWPEYDPSLIQEEKVTIVVQINGKVRDKIEVEQAKGLIQSEVAVLVKASGKTKDHLEGKNIKKVIFVPGKLINFVI